MSANAITLNGELYNVDGSGNRVSALAYGPAHVVVIAGANKIVRDLAAAEQRVKLTAAPCNAARLHTNTGCAKTGFCVDCKQTCACAARRSSLHFSARPTASASFCCRTPTASERT